MCVGFLCCLFINVFKIYFVKIRYNFLLLTEAVAIIYFINLESFGHPNFYYDYFIKNKILGMITII